MQPTQIKATKGSNLLQLDYDYTVSSGCNGATGTCNNGNVMSQDITVGAWSVGQTYAYGAFNRLASASEPGTSGHEARGRPIQKATAVPAREESESD